MPTIAAVTMQFLLLGGTMLMAQVATLPNSPSAWSRTWPVLVGALVGGAATILAQAFRAHVDSNKEREEWRVLMSLLVWKLEGLLEQVIKATNQHIKPTGDHFWQTWDELLAGRDKTGRSLSLLPEHIGIHVWLWFGRVARFRGLAEAALTDVADSYAAPSVGQEQRDRIDEREKWLVDRASALSQEGSVLVQVLNLASPKGWWEQVGSSKKPFQVPGIKIGEEAAPPKRDSEPGTP